MAPGIFAAVQALPRSNRSTGSMRVPPVTRARGTRSAGDVVDRLYQSGVEVRGGRPAEIAVRGSDVSPRMAHVARSRRRVIRVGLDAEDVAEVAEQFEQRVFIATRDVERPA